MEFSLYCVRRIKCLANYIFGLDFLFFMREDPLVENVFVASDYNENTGKIGSLEITNYADKEVLKRNKQYSQEYNELRKQEGNQIDAKHLYTRSWMQTINLTMACVVLAVYIYKHK